MVVQRVVLIGGAPGVGKTTLSRGLADRLGRVSLTFDDVMIGVRAATDPETRPELHPMRRAGGHVPYFTDSTPEQLIERSTALERATWPIVRALVDAHSRGEAPLVLDWWLLHPADVATLDPEQVAAVWIHLDPDVLRERERANTEFLDGSSDPGRMLDNFMARSLWRNDLAAREATRLGGPVLRLDGSESPREVVDRALAALT